MLNIDNKAFMFYSLDAFYYTLQQPDKSVEKGLLQPW